MPFATFLSFKPTSNFQYLPLFKPRDSADAPKYGPEKTKSYIEENFGAQLKWMQSMGQKWSGIQAQDKDAGSRLDKQLSSAAAAASSSSSSSSSSNPLPPELAAIMSKLDIACKGCRARVADCNTEEECSNASLALTYCMAGVICTEQANQFESALQRGGEGDMEKAYEAMSSCIEKFQVDAQKKIAQSRIITK
jgi:hypothetical protein